MGTPRVLILRAPGTNCDRETAFAFEQAGGQADIVHINRLLKESKLPSAYQILCIPGGFSYGDDIAAGRILANQIRHHLHETFESFKAHGKLILGICNGFQVLIKSNVLLPISPEGKAAATLTWNDSGKFEDRWVQLASKGDKCVFLQGTTSLYLPIAHAEGKFVARDEETLSQLDANCQLALRYTSCRSRDPEHVPYPDNPNGSLANVAGICDSTGRIFGLMPHPERHIHPTNHPRWTRAESTEQADGKIIFDNAIHYFS